MSELEVREAMKGIRKQAEDARRSQEEFLKEHALSESPMQAYFKALDPKFIIGTNPYADAFGIRHDTRGFVERTLGKSPSKSECSVEDGFKYPSLPDTFVGRNPFKKQSDSGIDVWGIGHRMRDSKVKESYCPPLYEARFAEDFRKQAASLRGGIDEYLKDTLKNKDLMTDMLGGVAVAKAVGIQPVYVTNWPEDESWDFVDTIETLAAVFTISQGLAGLLKNMRSIAIPTLRTGAAAVGGVAAEAALVETAVVGTELTATEAALGAGLVLGAPEIALILAAAAGGLYIQTEVYPDIIKSVADRLVGNDKPDRSSKSEAGEKPKGIFGFFGELLGSVKDLISPSSAFAYDAATLSGIGNYHGDSMRGLTDSAPETLAPQIKVTVNQAPIQNKVNMLKVKSGSRWRMLTQ